jgi:FdhD protein
VIVEPLPAGPARVEAVASEEPLEVRVRGTPLATLLRTPGRERDLIAGYLAAEGLLRAPEDLLGVVPCVDPETGAPAAHVWNAALAEGVAFDPRLARTGTVGSSCGMCGALLLEDLRRAPGLRPPPAAPELGVPALTAAFAQMRARQKEFARTAGTHGAALAWIGPGGTLELADVAEDVGRHNAVDKVLGAQLRAGRWPLERAAALLLSGRVSYEIIHKCARAGVAAAAGVGMPTSLAVQAARARGVALLGFVRDGRALRFAPESGAA